MYSYVFSHSVFNCEEEKESNTVSVVASLNLIPRLKRQETTGGSSDVSCAFFFLFILVHVQPTVQEGSAKWLGPIHKLRFPSC